MAVCQMRRWAGRLCQNAGTTLATPEGLECTLLTLYLVLYYAELSINNE